MANLIITGITRFIFLVEKKVLESGFSQISLRMPILESKFVSGESQMERCALLKWNFRWKTIAQNGLLNQQ